jgi:nucleotide-binding universal stress UspA family protein
MAVSFRNILFPTDFSRESMLALPYALAIARSYGSKLFAVHINREPLGAPASVRKGLQALQSERSGRNKEAIALLQARTQGVPSEMLFRRGDIWAELSDIIALKKIDLVVTGTHGRRGVSKLLEASVAETIFRHAACPVLTVGPAVSGEPGSIVDLHEILFATDFSKESLAALPYATLLAQQDGARLYLLHVAEEPLNRVSEDLLKARLRDLAPKASLLSCEPKVFVQYGTPAERILDLSEELAVDLVVMGVRRPPRYPMAGRTLRLHTAYAVACRAISPLLTIRA